MSERRDGADDEHCPVPRSDGRPPRAVPAATDDVRGTHQEDREPLAAVSRRFAAERRVRLRRGRVTCVTCPRSQSFTWIVTSI